MIIDLDSRVYVARDLIPLDVAVAVVGYDGDSETYIIAESVIDDSDGVVVGRMYTPDEYTGDVWFTYQVEVWDTAATICREQGEYHLEA